METALLIMVCILTVLVGILSFVILFKNRDFSSMEQRITSNIQSSVKMFNDTVSVNQKTIGNMQTAKFKEMDIVIKDMYDTMENKLEGLNKNMNQMHSLALGIDDLRKVLSNVKTRGILGETQLEAILEEILAHEQYEKNIATVPESRNTVEFAIKLPGKGDNPVYLPVDSKFPLDAYAKLCDARDSGNVDNINAASNELNKRIKQFAKDIHTKYIAPPYTTDFAIMFLPVESLYLEAVNSGLTEILQKEYKINIAGPSTFAAMLNALQIGFKTLAIEKHSVHIQDTLSEVKTEFNTFAEILTKVQTELRKADTDLEKLIGTRTRAIIRKLDNIEKSAD